MNHINYIKSFCEEYFYPQEAAESCCFVYQRIAAEEKNKEALDRAEEILFGEEEVDFNVIRGLLQKVAQDISANEYVVPLVFYIRATRRLKVLYEQNKIPAKIQRDTMEDLLCKAEECKMVNGCYGLMNPAFLYKHFRLGRFALGRLQYELGEFAGESCEIGGRVIKKGDLVIRCHIPRSGKSFNDAARLDSYKQAYEFFKEYFEDGQAVFTCDSWLLFELNEKILPPTSNIVRFMHDFKLLGVSYYDVSGSQLWRIFGRKYNGDPGEMPQETALQAGYKQWLLEGKQAGSSYGVFLFDGDRVINR